MLAGIVAFEWRYATRRLTFAAAALLFALMGYVLTATSFGADGIPVNAPYAIAYSLGFLSLLSVFAVTVIVAPALLRDTEHGMAEIVYATAVSKADYLVGRLTGSLLATFGALAFGVAGMLAATLRHEPDRVAPVRLLEYGWAFVVLAAPTMVLVAALLFTVAALTRRSLATSVAGVCVYVLYLVAAILTSSPMLASSGPVSPDEMALAALLDPFGLSAFFEQTHYWTPAERAVRRVSLSGRLLVNRLAWTAAAGLLLLLAHRLFAFRVAAPSRPADAQDMAAPVATAYRPVPATGGAWAAALAASLRLECRALLRSWPLAAILVVWTATAAIEVSENLRNVEYGTALWPTAGLLVATFHQPLMLFGLLVIVFFSAEVVWRERTARVAEVVDATPAPSALFLLSKVAALAVLALLMVGVPLVVGLGAQLALGHRPLQLAVHLSQLQSGGWPLVLFAVLAVALQTLAPNRHAGLLLALAAAIAFPLGALGAPDHPLLRYGAIVAPPWSDLAGFGPQSRVALAFTAYWTLVAAVLALLTAGLWRRGTDTRLGRRWRALPAALGPRGRRGLALVSACAVVVAALLFHQTNVATAWETPDERTAWKAAYERTYGHLLAAPQPRITHVQAAIDLFPSELRYRVRATYHLRNDTGTRVSEVWASARRDVRTVSVTVDGRPPSRSDARFGMHAFDVALEPGTTARLDFELDVDRSALTPSLRTDVAGNGSFVFGPLVLPAVGYRRGYEIEDPAERRRHGLPEGRVHEAGEPGLATLDVVVGTPADQEVVATGVLRETSERGGRRFSRFVADRPVQPIVAVAAARYAVARARRAGTDVEVLYHPAHARNVPHLLQAATEAVEGYSRRFGALPWPRLRIAEIPAHHREFAGFAVPAAVFLTEDRAFLTDLRDPGRIDIVTKRTAHEVAHQWWGHTVVPKDGPGASAVVESLARYSELLALRDRHGPGAVTAALQVELERYLAGRARDHEVPLDEVEDQAWIYYAKGALVMNAIDDLVGEEAVGRALAALVAQARGGGPSPGVHDLVRHLRAVTPPAHHALLDELWSEVVLYDLRVTAARAEKLAGGRYRVTATVEAGKTIARDGRETVVPMRDAIEIAAFASHPTPGAPPLHVARLVPGATTATFEVDAPPAFVVADPRLLRIDRNPADNTRKIELE